MNIADTVKDRIKNVMINDRSHNAENVIKVLRSDEYSLLSDYFSLEPENLKVSLSLCDGGYYLKIEAIVERILDSGSIIE